MQFCSPACLPVLCGRDRVCGSGGQGEAPARMGAWAAQPAPAVRSPSVRGEGRGDGWRNPAARPRLPVRERVWGRGRAGGGTSPCGWAAQPVCACLQVACDEGRVRGGLGASARVDVVWCDDHLTEAGWQGWADAGSGGGMRGGHCLLRRGRLVRLLGGGRCGGG